MSIVVTGATGRLGGSVVQALLARGVDASTIVAVGRQAEKLKKLASQGVTTRVAEFSDPDSLDAAFAGAEKVLLVSGGEPDRLAQHRNVIDAAKRAGVSLFAYTSGPKADTNSAKLLADHRATEEAIAASGLPAVVLRNGWYVENYTGQLPTLLEHGMVGSAGEGRISLALIREFGEAAAAALTGDGHEGKVYELGGTPVSLPEIAAAISATVGQPITYTDVPVETLRGILEGAGLPAPVADTFSDVDRAIAAGEFANEPADLTALLGREPLPLEAAVAEALADR